MLAVALQQFRSALNAVAEPDKQDFQGHTKFLCLAFPSVGTDACAIPQGLALRIRCRGGFAS